MEDSEDRLEYFVEEQTDEEFEAIGMGFETMAKKNQASFVSKSRRIMLTAAEGMTAMLDKQGVVGSTCNT